MASVGARWGFGLDGSSKVEFRQIAGEYQAVSGCVMRICLIGSSKDGFRQVAGGCSGVGGCMMRGTLDQFRKDQFKQVVGGSSGVGGCTMRVCLVRFSKVDFRQAVGGFPGIGGLFKSLKDENWQIVGGFPRHDEGYFGWICKGCVQAHCWWILRHRWAHHEGVVYFWFGLPRMQLLGYGPKLAHAPISLAQITDFQSWLFFKDLSLLSTPFALQLLGYGPKLAHAPISLAQMADFQSWRNPGSRISHTTTGLLDTLAQQRRFGSAPPLHYGKKGPPGEAFPLGLNPLQNDPSSKAGMSALDEFKRRSSLDNSLLDRSRVEVRVPTCTGPTSVW
ncbi:hypothetical protein DUNSADRAFT_11955 [Dunaliella salina]|uniref:Encoded protein n=1 Tax=Dunaliella salina TaxID=3046 RepID=A0ABQ7GC88_DUNSA|nr:hypothetical protein DUNSADRAFT_11955 [Dunaliella salina]|eukprot:KAF5832226.1 hypothetical protein DUNSADRAFT_11955 [Dunaliella salina]